jgi:hypothetical protein
MAGTQRWSVEQRIAFAEQRLFWDGSLNRDDLMRQFGISANQATADLGRLKALHPDAVAYNTVAKRYQAAAGFDPVSANAAALLTELRLLAEGRVAADQSVLAAPPPLAIADAPARAVDRTILRQVLAAIRDGAAFSAAYVSFQREEVTRRTISPHALVFDGFRWHARAHDAEDDRFKDFVLSRLGEVEPGGHGRRPGEADEEWNTFASLVIAPHPGLTPHQRAVICRDYGMDANGRLGLRVRRAVLFYVLKRLGLSEGHERRPAAEQHVVLASAGP